MHNVTLWLWFHVDNETAALSLLSGRCHDNLEELLRQVAASSDLLRQPVYERSAAENEQSRQGKL